MKILIFAKKSELENKGGPSGYLYNLLQYLDSNPVEEIHFLPENKLRKKWTTRLCSMIEIILANIPHKPKILCYLLSVYSLYFREFRYSKRSMEFFNSFDIIHIHFPAHMVQHFAKNKIKGKLVLTSHCPEPHNDEWASIFGYRDFLFRHQWLRRILLNRELKAYDICDRIMFPVPQAREPYELSSSLFKEKFSKINNKFFYIPTALYTTKKTIENDNILSKYNINNTALRICYIGRHNTIKGYDFLQSVAKIVWKVLPDAHFVIGGEESPIKGLVDYRWIELGWVNTARLLNEVDVFILPNQNTFFDIILLEVLRQGTPVILSRTGGNKWYENKNDKGMFFFNYGDLDELLKKILEINEIKQNGKLNELKEYNMQFFQQQFNMCLFFKRYLENMKKMY